MAGEIAFVSGGIAGHVYLIGPRDGQYKIGRTSDIFRRFGELRAENYETAHLIQSSHSNAVERILHVAFSKSHAGREWFRLTDSEVDLVKSFSRANSGDDIPAEIVDRYTLNASQEKPSVSYRLTVEELAALERYAEENDRTVAAESARAVRKYLREVGVLPDKK